MSLWDSSTPRRAFWGMKGGGRFTAVRQRGPEVREVDEHLYRTTVSPAAAQALDAARAVPRSYSVRAYASNDPTPRIVVALGEAHVKLDRASRLGKAVVEQFELRGVESFQTRTVLVGWLFGAMVKVPRNLLRTLSFGRIKQSTIDDAKRLPTGSTDQLERGHRVPAALHAASIYCTVYFGVTFLGFVLDPFVLRYSTPFLSGWFSVVEAIQGLFLLHFPLLLPAWLLRDRPWSWLIHPAVGILTARDAMMAAGTRRMLDEHPQANSALVVFGRAHQHGFGDELVERFGFRRIV